MPLIFAGLLLLLKKAAFLGKLALFVSGLLGFSGLFSIGDFSGVNHHHHHRPPFFGSSGGLGGGGVHFGDHHHDTLSGGYYKSNVFEYATTEKDPQFADTFYNYEKKLLQNKSDKIFDKEPKTTTEQTARANSYRSFVWKTL